MRAKNNNTVFVFLGLFITVVFVLPFITSCGKSGVASGVSSNTQLEVINASPNVGPVDLYANFIKQNTSSYIYTYPGSYFYISQNDTPYQVRTTQQPNTNLISLSTILQSNHKYSLFITGLATSNSISDVFTIDDTEKTPPAGYGTIRFINLSIQSQNVGLDVSANDTPAFSAIKYQQVSNYILLPAGSYNFQINATGTPSVIFSTPSIQSITIQDGRLYTMYAYGVVGQIDTSAFTAAIITNR
jgi:hypothetical protein